MKTTLYAGDTELWSGFRITFANLILAADRNDLDWDATMKAFARHGLSETIVAAPFTKLGWARHSLAIERTRLGERKYLEEVTEWLTREWMLLIQRDIDAVAETTLATITPQQLLEILSTLYINESTGKGVALFVLSRQAAFAMDASCGVNRAFRELDERLAVVMTRTHERADAAFENLRHHLEDKAFASNAEPAGTAEQGARGVAIQADACFCPAKRGFDAQVEANCRVYLNREEHYCRRN